MPSLERIAIYPIKSLDGVEVSRVRVLPNGALQNDRRYALVDPKGDLVNAKRVAAMQRIRTEFNEPLTEVTLTCDSESHTFSLIDQREELAAWCSELLGIGCRLAENSAGGFPDDSDSPGPTVISDATLGTIATWFPEFSTEEIWRRLRTNLEVSAEEPFWEDRLVQPADGPVFRIGGTSWRGNRVCQRCAVPTRDSYTGTAKPGFAKTFSSAREQALPPWSPHEQFDHYYRVAINTNLVATDRAEIISVGDELEFVED